MAHMHSRHKGKSGSNRPHSAAAPSWIQLDAEQVIELILKLAKEGNGEADIGRILRDGHGLPSVKKVTGKTISRILKENGTASAYPVDLMDLIKRAMGLRRHLKQNSQDNLNATALTKTESKIRRLVRYYSGKKLPAGWKYDPEKAALLVK